MNQSITFRFSNYNNDPTNRKSKLEQPILNLFFWKLYTRGKNQPSDSDEQ